MTPHLADTPVLETKRLALRAPAPQDWEPWLAFAATGRAQFVGGPFTRALAWRAFCHMLGLWIMRGYGLFVFTEKGADRALGSAGVWFPEGWPEPELGWTIWSPSDEGKGLAHEAAVAARDHAFDELGLTTVVSYIAPANLRSIALAERLGAVRDPLAAKPEGDNCLVYRHTAIGATP